VSLLTWIVLGLVAGFIASKVVNRTGEGFARDIVLGIVGAVVGGWLVTTLGVEEVAGFNAYSVLVSVVGAILLLVLYHTFYRSAR